jgi:NADPH:quinone reductase
MKAVEITRPGGPEVLQLVERPDPVPGPGEVLIRVAASGINRPDLLQRMGRYAPPPGASDLPGLEVAGTVVQGEGEGQQVCALLAGGGYAEYAVAPIGQCLPVPRGLTLVEAASLPETFFTVWSNVFDRARLTGRESLLVQGGSSGIGITAIQMAHALGHPVFATAGTEDKCRACEALGARAINYKTEDFVERIRAFTEGRGVDVILDMVAGDYIPRELDALADDGRLALIATLGGSTATVDVGTLLRRRQTITGSTLRPRPVEFKAAIALKLREVVWPLIESGKIRPVIQQVFPAAEASQAHALLESGTHIGKLVLEW